MFYLVPLPPVRVRQRSLFFSLSHPVSLLWYWHRFIRLFFRNPLRSGNIPSNSKLISKKAFDLQTDSQPLCDDYDALCSSLLLSPFSRSPSRSHSPRTLPRTLPPALCPFYTAADLGGRILSFKPNTIDAKKRGQWLNKVLGVTLNDKTTQSLTLDWREDVFNSVAGKFSTKAVDILRKEAEVAWIQEGSPLFE